jgi:hypothetical protein
LLAHVDETGTLEGCDHLDQEDMAEAESRFVDAFPPEPMTSHAWDDPDRWELEPVIPPDLDDDLISPELEADHQPFDPDDADREWWARCTENNGHSIAGPSPIHPEPTNRDWDEMARWAEEVYGPPRGGPCTDEDIIIATGCCG